jgi:hypothetical protein
MTSAQQAAAALRRPADPEDLEARLAAVEARLAMLTAAVAELVAGRGEDHDEDGED